MDFKKFFKKSEPKSEPKISETAQGLINYLGCDYVHIPKGTELSEVNRVYDELFEKRTEGGYTPIIFGIDEYIMENVDGYIELLERDNRSTDIQKEILAAEPIDAEKWFRDELSWWKEEIGDGWDGVIGEIENGEECNELHGMLDHDLGLKHINEKKSLECVIAKIPVTNPWEIFAWFPLGGWNECPRPEDMFWIGKYWYEKYGAIPAVMTHDVLEFKAGSVKDKTAALDLALEQFAFCQDIVFQGVETIGRLADSLTKSSTWFFWWD